jgi:predicted Rossmann fold nucleotide-binding protein DprA/Smf involved in DNA uptake
MNSGTNKHYMAYLAAFLITACMGASMLLIGGSALFNRNGEPVENSASAAASTTQARSAEQAQVQQLQSLVNQYQARETQYQQELKTAADNLQQANAQLQQYQMLLMALQNRGLISINPDGSISVAR